jgi:hypothetical protein
VNLVQTANAIYYAIKNDGQACAKVRKELATLALSIALDPGASATVTSATVNGQSFTASPLMTSGERLNLLRYVVGCLDYGGTISTTRSTDFG